METQEGNITLDNNSTSVITSLHSYEADSTAATEAGYTGHPEAQSLADFISKPRLIEEATIPSGGMYVLDPVTSLLTPQVMKRLMYFKRLRGNIKLQFICNPNVYDAGIIMASVAYDMAGTIVPTTRGYVKNLFTKTHVLMDLGSQTTGELKFPLNYKDPYLDISKPITAGDAQVAISSFTPSIVNVTTGSPSSVTVKIYACIEDAEISGPVHFGSNFVYSAGGKKDAEVDLVSDGLISFPASIVANIGKRLKDVPIIGPFAYASGIIATGIAKMAILFGYSRPQIMTDIPYPHVEDYASYAGPMRLKTLTLDPLQEIPIGTAHLGTKTDPLSFENLISREGLIAELSWQASSPSGTLIAALNVSPTTCDYEGSGYHANTPLSYISSFYTAYRGSIILEVYIAANRYNNGKLRLSFVPQSTSYSSELASLSQNALTTVVDLSVSTKVSFTLPYLKTQPYSPILPPKSWSTARQDTDIGIFTIHVESQLRNQGNVPLDILVTSRAGPDFELQLPQTNLIASYNSISYPTAQGVTWSLSDTTYENTAQDITFTTTLESAGTNWQYSMKSSAVDPVVMASIKMDRSIETDAPAQLMMGEKFTSIRPLLKRFYYHTTVKIKDGVQTKLPSIPRLGPLTRFPTTLSYATTLTANTPLTLITSMFRGYTGSIRVMIIPRNSNYTSITISRDYAQGDYCALVGGPNIFSKGEDGDPILRGFGECTFYRNEPIVFRVPYQGQSQYNSLEDFAKRNNLGVSTTPGFIITARNESNTSDIGTFDVYYAIDEDYQPCVWNGIPPYWQYSVPALKTE